MKKLPPTNDEFRKQCRRCFRYLTTDFGFRELTALTDEPAAPFRVCYSKEEFVISVEGISWGHAVNIVFRHRDHCSVGFGHLLTLRDRAALVACAGAEGQLAQLRAYARVLRSYASDLLAGDMDVLATAKAEKDRAYREHRKEEQRLRRQELRKRRATSRENRE
jgi:hypothetical protein